MIKSILVRLFLPVLLTASLAACGNDDTGSTSTDTSSAPQVTSTSSAPSTPAAAPSTPAAAPSAPASNSGALTEPEARAAALAAAGAGASVRSVEEGEEDGRQIYDYDITVPNGKREIKIDRATGEIVKNELDD